MLIFPADNLFFIMPLHSHIMLLASLASLLHCWPLWLVDSQFWALVAIASSRVEPLYVSTFLFDSCFVMIVDCIINFSAICLLLTKLAIILAL